MKIKFFITILTIYLTSSFAIAGGTGENLPEAHAAMNDSSTVNVDNKWDYIRFRPQGGVAKKNSCLIFYPGALVDPKGYAPYGQALAAQGYLTYILKVPIGMSLLEPGAANDVKWFDYYALRYCDHYVISGHSLGGVTAVDYVNYNPNDDLILLASYPQEFTSIEDQDTRVTSIYGTNDCQISQEDIEGSRLRLPAHTKFVEIVGGNHQQFGWYLDDVPPECQATENREYQTSIIIDEMIEMLSIR